MPQQDQVLTVGCLLSARKTHRPSGVYRSGPIITTTYFGLNNSNVQNVITFRDRYLSRNLRTVPKNRTILIKRYYISCPYISEYAHVPRHEGSFGLNTIIQQQ